MLKSDVPLGNLSATLNVTGSTSRTSHRVDLKRTLAFTLCDRANRAAVKGDWNALGRANFEARKLQRVNRLPHEEVLLRDFDVGTAAS